MTSSSSYILHISRFECTCCGNAWEHSALFSLSIHGEQRRLEPATEILPDRMIGFSKLQVKQVPVCYLCVEHLEQQARRNIVEAEARWQETLARKNRENGGSPERIATRAPRPSAPKPSGIPDIADL